MPAPRPKGRRERAIVAITPLAVVVTSVGAEAVPTRRGIETGARQYGSGIVLTSRHGAASTIRKGSAKASANARKGAAPPSATWVQ